MSSRNSCMWNLWRQNMTNRVLHGSCGTYVILQSQWQQTTSTQLVWLKGLMANASKPHITREKNFVRRCPSRLYRSPVDHQQTGQPEKTAGDQTYLILHIWIPLATSVEGLVLRPLPCMFSTVSSQNFGNIGCIEKVCWIYAEINCFTKSEARWQSLLTDKPKNKLGKGCSVNVRVLASCLVSSVGRGDIENGSANQR